MTRFASGTRIGRYQVADLLGSGGMGDVYLVREEETGWYWALKTLRAGGPESEIWKRFMNEGQVHSELRHHCIAAFREMFIYADRPCLIMEYVDGETLFTRIQRMGRLPAGESLRILNDVCDALVYLHGLKILHRDLKSANVKINSVGRIKLLDFGIAKHRRAAGMTVAGAVMGTPEYLAPELILGHPASVQSEVWTLGLLAYEMLTGRLPFNDEREAALYDAIRNRDPDPPSRYNPEAGGAVDSLVLRCLEKKPGRRFRSPAHLKKAIAKALGESPRNEIGQTAREAVNWLGALPRRVKLWSGAAAAALLLAFVLWAVGGGADSQSITLEVVEGPADVFENGSRVGRTPYRVRAKAGDTIQVELRRQGFVDQPVQFEVTERKVYSYTMQRANPPQ